MTGALGCCRRKLHNKLAPQYLSYQPWTVGPLGWHPFLSHARAEQIVDYLGCWWRPDFDDQTVPYIPSHVTKPKEVRKIFVVQLPEKFTFHVPAQEKPVVVPLYSLYDNAQEYGQILSSIPSMLSRVELSMKKGVDGGN